MKKILVTLLSVLFLGSLLPACSIPPARLQYSTDHPGKIQRVYLNPHSPYSKIYY